MNDELVAYGECGPGGRTHPRTGVGPDVHARCAAGRRCNLPSGPGASRQRGRRQLGSHSSAAASSRCASWCATSPSRQEHIRRFMAGGLTTDVTYAYKHLLGRDPDPDGLKSHEQVRTSGGRWRGDRQPSSTRSNISSSFSDDTVPGSQLRFCGPGGAATAGCDSRQLDANRNGAIERSEWNGTAASFNVHDWNGDGVLSGEEVRVGGRRAARVQAAERLRPDRSGHVDRAELPWCSTAIATTASAPASGTTARNTSGVPTVTGTGC